MTFSFTRLLIHIEKYIPVKQDGTSVRSLFCMSLMLSVMKSHEPYSNCML